MKHTIIYFIGVYDTLDLFTGKLREAFETMGYASFVYDARLPQSKDALLSVLAESSSPEREFSCVTFNNLGYNLDMEVPAPAQSVRENDACIQKGGTRNVWEYYGIPYLNILMDHPFHYEKPLRLAPETSVVLCTDRNHVKYIRRYFKNIHVQGKWTGRNAALLEKAFWRQSNSGDFRSCMAGYDADECG